MGWNPASAVSATTRIGGQEVALYSLHAAGASSGDAPNPAERHIGKLLDHVLTTDNRPVIILAGDFNDRMGEPVMDYCLNRGFRSSWQDLGLNVDRASGLDTWQANGPAREGGIDHLLYQTELPFSAVEEGILVLDPPPSDHHPVWAEFQIQPAP